MSRFVVLYNTNNNNQVMYFNSRAGDDYPTDEFLAETGCTLAVVTDVALQTKIFEMFRECKAVLTDGVVTDFTAETNSTQPAVVTDEDYTNDKIAALEARIATLEGS